MTIPPEWAFVNSQEFDAVEERDGPDAGSDSGTLTDRLETGYT